MMIRELVEKRVFFSSLVPLLYILPLGGSILV